VRFHTLARRREEEDTMVSVKLLSEAYLEEMGALVRLREKCG
jgi:hypothetical protein